MVFFENIVCGPSLNCTPSLQRSLLILLSIIGYHFFLYRAVFGTLNIIFLCIFFHNNTSQKKDSFNTENAIFLVFYQIYRVIMAFFLTFRYIFFILLVLQNTHTYGLCSLLYFWVIVFFYSTQCSLMVLWVLQHHQYEILFSSL
jgi:hypothetical protein